MKISELTPDIVKDYCGISDDDSDDIIEKLLLPAARKYITGYTGLTAEQCDEHEELSVACMVLVNDMFTQRDYTVSMHRQVSPTVKTILDMYAVNYI
ncbi:MAG: phage gp6-like head-tail connector protein [Ruminococcus sp.]|nr:phage gp6-like head-tail connector protein [Ruminococcus sp.]